MKTTLLTLLLAASLALSGLAQAQTPKPPKPPKPPTRPAKPTLAPPLEAPLPEVPTSLLGMKVSSAAFKEGEVIPKDFGCLGRNVSPALTILDVPANTKSVALLLNDPDARGGSFAHWLVYDLPVKEMVLAEAQPKTNNLPKGGTQGRNDFKNIGYDGPCPPEGYHRYEFTAYALDSLLGLPAGATRAELEKAMKGHVLKRATLMGRYSKD
jgi:Raf kinase inhibitor-like YbhB/YbcL family protein